MYTCNKMTELRENVMIIVRNEHTPQRNDLTHLHTYLYVLCLHVWLYSLVSLCESVFVCLHVCAYVSVCLCVRMCMCTRAQRTDGSFGFLDLALDRGASHSHVDAGTWTQVLHQESKCSEALRPRCSSPYPMLPRPKGTTISTVTADLAMPFTKSLLHTESYRRPHTSLYKRTGIFQTIFSKNNGKSVKTNTQILIFMSWA